MLIERYRPINERRYKRIVTLHKIGDMLARIGNVVCVCGALCLPGVGAGYIFSSNYINLCKLYGVIFI